MPIRAASLELLWDATVVDTVAASQRWVLTAMQRNGESLVTMLWRILGDDHDVCDAYQETFLRLAHYQQGRKPDNVKAFVFRTASNVGISILRRKKRHAKACQAIATRPHKVQATDPGCELDAQWLRETLRSHITRLPERLQSVVLLKDLADLPYAQVARILGISVASARVYRCRAIRLLSSWMVKPEERS